MPPVARARSLSERRTEPPSLAVHGSPHREMYTLSSILTECDNMGSKSIRKAFSEKSSPNLSVVSVDCARSEIGSPIFLISSKAPDVGKCASDIINIAGDPWRKMSDLEVRPNRKPRNIVTHLSLENPPESNDPWVKNFKPNPSVSPRASNREVYTPSRRNTKWGSAVTLNDNIIRRGKLERKSPVTCDKCLNESCECWRPRSPMCPRTPRLNELRQKRVISSPVTCTDQLKPLTVRSQPSTTIINGSGSAQNVQCTCDKLPRRSVSPRLTPIVVPPSLETRAVTDEVEKVVKAALVPETNAPPLKSPPQKICTVDNLSNSDKKNTDPLLETTC